MSLRKAQSLLVAVLAFFATCAWSQPYALLQPPQPTDGGGKVEVVEFFWYGCPHCYHLEPSVNAWVKRAPKDVVFKRVPAIPSDAWAPMASLFYTLEAMGLLEQYHQKVFEAIHKDNENLVNKTVREKWLAKNGIDIAKYNEVEKSFTVATKLTRARQMTHAYKVDSVPKVVVNGKYVTSAEQAGSPEAIFPTVDQIVAIARKDKG